MNEFEIAERTEPFTFGEICDFIDTSDESKLYKHELKSMIADCLQAERNKVVEDCVKFIREHSGEHYVDCEGYFGLEAETIFRCEWWLEDMENELMVVGGGAE